MNKFKIPCVIVHTGYKSYLKHNLEITSKNNEVFVIGDLSLKKLENINSNIKFINIEKYESINAIKEYEKGFVNFSTQPIEFEWFCFKRVFIMYQFLLENNLEQLFHIDSDNILLEDINSFIFDKKNAYCIPTFQQNFRMDSSIHSGLLDLDFFESFQNLFRDIYLNKSKFSLIKDKIEYHKQNNIKGGITDMTLYYLMQKTRIISPQNLMEPIKNLDGMEYVFLNNLNLAEGIKIKKITRKIEKDI